MKGSRTLAYGNEDRSADDHEEPDWCNSRDFYPIVVSRAARGLPRFLPKWFGLEVVFEASGSSCLPRRRQTVPAWLHASLASDRSSGARAVQRQGHVSRVPGGRTPPTEYERFEREGASPVLSLRDEPFGQRRFGSFDPAGVWIDVVEQIEPGARLVGPLPFLNPG